MAPPPSGDDGGRRHVLVVGLNYAPETTGIGPYTSGMCAALSEQWDVTVATAHPHYPEWRVAGAGGWRSVERRDGTRVVRYGHFVPRSPSGIRRILSEATFAARILLARHARPDLVVAVSPGLLPSAVAVLLARRWHVPSAVVVQDLYSKAVSEAGVLHGRAEAPVRRLEGWVLRSAAGVTTIHRRMADAIGATYGVPSSRVIVIPNWTHIQPPEADRAGTRRAMGWGDETVVLHAGNMGAKQGLDHVVRAARLGSAAVRGGGTRFVLMGDGNQRSMLDELAADVQNLDVIDPVPSGSFSDVLAAADVLLLHEKPGVEEMCAPSKLTSYFAAGRPVLAATSETSAAADEVRSAGAGRVVPSADPDALLDAVDEMAADPAELARMGARGQAYAVSRLSKAASLAAYQQWVEQVAEP